VKIPYRRGASLIYVRDGRDCKDHHESEHVRYELDGHDYKIICAHDDRCYARGDRGYVNDGRDYVRYDHANDGHDYDLYTENAVFLFSILPSLFELRRGRL
jgi:hypothetical protein